MRGKLMHLFHSYEPLRTKFFSKKVAFDILESDPHWNFHGLDALKVLEYGYHEEKSICLTCGKIRINYYCNPYLLSERLFEPNKETFTQRDEAVFAIAKSRNLLKVDFV